jgi:hypothetical protein
MVARRSSEDLGFVPQTWLAAKDLKSSIALMTKRETLLACHHRIRHSEASTGCVELQIAAAT